MVTKSTKRRTTTSSKRQKRKTVAVLTDRGRLVTQDILKQFEIGPTTKQIEGTAWKPDIIEPPHNLARLMSWLEQNVIHNSCVRVKQQDAVGIGYEIVANEDYFSDPDKEIPEKEKDSNYNMLKEFFAKVNSSEDLVSVLKKVFLDYEGCGNGYLEVSRDIEDKINGLFHVNATTIRWMKDRKRLVQKVGEKYVHFKVFGEEDILDKNSGKWEKKEDSTLPPEQQANEIINFTQYTWKSSLYGLPEWLPALYSMFGDQKEKEYNIDFFLNYGIPAYAVIIEGASMKREDRETLTKYFETELKGSNHKTLTMATPKGTQVKFERLSVETKEASFRMYHQDNKDDILVSHHVPPYRVGIVVSGQLGGSIAESADRIYLDSVINPRQEQFAWCLNELIIKLGFGINEWLVRFQDINVEDMKQTSEIHDRYFKMGAMTQNEIRGAMGLDPFVGGDIFYLPTSLVPVGISQEGIDSGRTDGNLDGISDEERQAGEEEAASQENEEPAEEEEEVTT